MKTRITKSKTLLLPFESKMYLWELSLSERCGKHFTKEEIERKRKSFFKIFKNGIDEYYDGDLGGAKNGKWTSWSCDDVKRILSEQGLPFEVCEEKTSIGISL